MTPLADTSPTLLCVDDEPSVLAGLTRQLRHHFRITTAENGKEALQLLEDTPAEFAVIMSDMMMPGMNGAEFLRRVREVSPRSVRVLLTGHADADVAAAAINDGAISRYLTKPCPSERLVSTLRDCADSFRRSLIEQEVLDHTLTASVDVLAHTLALASPSGFARIARARDIARELIAVVDPPDSWAVEVAVPLSQAGAITLPQDVLERWAAGHDLSADEQRLVDGVPEASIGLIRGIPRLDVVEQIIRGAALGAAERREPARLHCGARIVRLAFEVDNLESHGLTRTEAVDALRHRAADDGDEADASILGRLADGPETEVVLVGIDELEPGMVLTCDACGSGGHLLAARGTSVTDAVVARLRHFEAAGQALPEFFVRRVRR